MMRTPDDRIAELMAAALAGELTPGEVEEWEALRRRRPDVEDEFRELATLSNRLREGDVTWTPPRDIDALGDRILRAVDAETESRGMRSTVTAAPARRSRRWLAPIVAAACLVVGIAIGVSWPDPAVTTPSGPPGTLGAIEPVALDGVPDDVEIEADLVAHTWGTETVVEATGLDVGATYEVVLIDESGVEYSAGAMLGSEVPIECRLNAALMRTEAVRLEVRAEDRSILAQADLPEA
ncbi:anti-sigma factor [Microbacterium sp. ET2]|uniref:anti-sigma factor n=1 Tax=Microbacterium albipurpureum TaxID=3050384 RepID=UPI00259CEF49|nr:anti-sigma factor [Microbacterium sp. ET2 (Ac-2212)]WJL95972.1 anti-sigma factor [Microbacterium sp. ET2 (Ac-2212)]